MNSFVVESGLLQASLAGTIVVAAVWAADRLLGKTISHRLWYAVWMLVLLRFMLLIVPGSSFSFWHLVPSSPVHQTVANTPLAVPFEGSMTPMESTLAQAEFPEDADFDTSTPPSSRLGVPHWLDLIWLAGLTVAMARLVCHIRFTRQLIRRATEVSRWDARMDSISKTLNVRNCLLLATKHQRSPCVVGFWKPAILIPQWCLEELDDVQIELVLAHELTHIVRKDGWAQLATAIVAAVHWFNPVAWLLNRKLEYHRELACDQSIVDRIRSGQLAGSETEYGNALIRVAEHHSNLDPVPAFARGLIDHNQALIKERIAMLNTSGRTSFLCKILLCGVCLPLLLAGGYTTLPAQTAKPMADDGQPEQAPVSAGTQGSGPAETTSVKNQADDSSNTYPIYDQPGGEVAATGIDLQVGENRVLRFEHSIPKFSVSNPAAMQVVAQAADLIQLTGKAPGRGTIEFTDSHGQRIPYLVRVMPNDPNAQDAALHGKPNLVFECFIYEYEDAELDRIRRELKSDPPNVALKPRRSSFWFAGGDDLFSAVKELEQEKRIKQVDEVRFVTQGDLAAVYRKGAEIPFKVKSAQGADEIEFQLIGHEIRVQVLELENDIAEVEIRIESSAIDSELPTVNGTPGYRARRISTGMEWKLGSTKLFCIESPNRLVVLTPRAVPVAAIQPKEMK